MSNKNFLFKVLSGTDLQLCYVSGYVQEGHAHLFVRNTKLQPLYDLGTLPFKEASLLYVSINSEIDLNKHLKK